MLGRNCAAFGVLFVLFSSLCCGFVLISSSVVGAGGVPEGHIYEAGSAWLYRYTTEVLLDEKDEGGKNVGFLIGADLSVESLWSSSHSRFLKFDLKSQKLFIKSRNARKPDGYTSHSSKLETQANSPFYAHWTKGKIEKIFLKKGEPLSSTNLKKGIASLFQFQLLDEEIEEIDASGRCTATYQSTTPTKFRKIKVCKSDLVKVKNPDLLLSAGVVSSRTSLYELNSDNDHLIRVEAEEWHEMHVAAKEDVGNRVQAHQTLNFVQKGTCESIDASDFEEALKKIDENGDYIEQDLQTKIEYLDDGKNFASAVQEHRENLRSKYLGELAPAKSFIQLVTIGRKSSKEDIVKTLSGKKNQKILPQLYDVLGYVQTLEGHNAVMKKLHFDDGNQDDLSERYLWALSVASQSNPEIIMDLLNRYKKIIGLSKKIEETLLSTLASMTNRLAKLSHSNAKVINTIKEALLNGFKAAKPEERPMFLRAIRNLKVKLIIPDLLDVLKTANEKENVLVWKALRSMQPTFWNEDVLSVAFRTFFELDRKQDSSSRTLALDIILQSNPNDQILQDLLRHLVWESQAFEVKQYLLQQLKMIGDENPNFRKRVSDIVRNDPKLHNWDVLSQKGLSTALSRNLWKSPSSNGTLLTIQEIHGGIVKRGIVDVLMEKDGVINEIFSLGVFSGGLGGFLTNDAEETEEVATAGMELSILGTHIRPFVFFEGQGELMGHVWSGTASEKTTAYQALVMLQDHSQFVPLGSGFATEIDLKGAVSFDLSGTIEFSLWNRNAVSSVEKSAGVAVVGTLKVDTAFVRSQVEFSLAVEPKLNLQTDIDFSSGVNLCMRLSQPESTFRHKIFKIERIPGSKHHLRKSKYKKHTIPGATYALNKKNNDMCNTIFR